VLFRGVAPEVLASGDGRILAVGRAAVEMGAGARVVELEGRVLPGLGDSHLHLHELVRLRLDLDLSGTRTAAGVLRRVAARSRRLRPEDWVVGSGWSGRLFPGGSSPSRGALDRAAGGRPVVLLSRDEHSVWASTRALEMAGIPWQAPDPHPMVVDRDADGAPTGLVREGGPGFLRQLPRPDGAAYERALERVLQQLSSLGLCSVHSMDPPETYFALQRLHSRGRLPLRVTYNLPADLLEDAGRLGLRQGLGDPWLRLYGVKAFVDGSLGSGTAEMQGGGGVARLSDSDLRDLVELSTRTELNLCLHAIGDMAVHRALRALRAGVGSWPGWRPRIEHAQLVDPADVALFKEVGAVASMQPLHAPADREMADRMWTGLTGNAYAWGRLARAGVRLAFGSDAPVESADPILGLEAATGWRRRAGWHPELALTWTQALKAYTSGVAFAGGVERQEGWLRPGYRCDLTVVRGREVVATVVDGVVRSAAPDRT
jgi:predicted amidohydrolase YtcJ